MKLRPKLRAKRYLKYPVKAALVILNKVSNSTYKKLYPHYLRWLGMNISKDFASYSDPWISPACVFDAAGYNLISVGDGTTISFDAVFHVHDFRIDKSLFAKYGSHGKLLASVTVGKNCFIGARAFILPGTTIGDNCIAGWCRPQREMPRRLHHLRQTGERRGQRR